MKLAIACEGQKYRNTQIIEKLRYRDHLELVIDRKEYQNNLFFECLSLERGVTI